MTNLERDPQETDCGGQPAPTAAFDVIAGRKVYFGPRSTVIRWLPDRARRMVGAWCFADHFGPDEIGDGPGMQVAPHPHTGLQTVSWLFEGEVLHRDSIGSAAIARPGAVNVMTAGRGIAHSELSAPEHSPVLHGLQLWVALPHEHRFIDPAFTSERDLPRISLPDAEATLFLGEYAGQASPAPYYSPLVGLSVVLNESARTPLPLRPEWEYALICVDGDARLDGADLEPGTLTYLGEGRTTGALTSVGGARVVVLGGEPFDERIVMWWNFIGRDHDEIVAFREAWEADRGFGDAVPDSGDRLPAPPMPALRLKPRGRGPETQ